MSVNRPELGRIWALNGARFDPGTQKYQLGWTAEIPTYEVLNYLQYRVDLALLAASERGIPEWGSDLTYGLGSVVWDNTNSKMYVSKVATPNKSKAPSTNTADWEESCTQFTMNAFLQIDQKIDAHIGRADNPHGVTAEQVNTYIKSVIDQKVSNVATDLSNHAGRRDNPHGTTAAGIGAVPATGGTYTGAVTFNSPEVKINSGAGDHAVHADSDILGLRYADVYLGLRKSDNRAVLKVAGNTSVLLSESEYVEARRVLEPEYAVPDPDVWIDALNDINLKQGFGFTELVRGVTADYTDKSGRVRVAGVGEPRQERNGLRLDWSLDKERLDVDASNNLFGVPEATWFFEFVWAGNGRSILYWDDSGAQDHVEVSATGTVTVFFSDADGAERGWVAGTTQAGVVSRLAVSYNSQRVRTYLNGVAGATGDQSFSPQVAEWSKFYLGYPATSPVAPVGVWWLRQFKIWHRVLTPEQISTL